MASNKAKAKTKAAKQKNTRRVVCLVILFVFFVAFFIGLGFQNKIDDALGFREVKTYDAEEYGAGQQVTVGALNIYFIDVGQGDSCLIELPDNKTILIDAGENKTAVKQAITGTIDEVNQTRELLSPQKPQITYLDYAIVTHSDADHVGSFPFILGEYPAKTVYRPNEQATPKAGSGDSFVDPASLASGKNGLWGTRHGIKNTDAYIDAIKAVYQTADEIIVTNPHDDTQNMIAPEGISTDDDLYYEINFYGPVNSYYNNYNDYSPIIIIEYKGRRIMLSGDSEAKGEADFVAAVNGGEGRYSIFDSSFTVDVLKLGHHGSGTSSSEGLLDIMTKGGNKEDIYIIISCGKFKEYGHPSPLVLERLDSMGFDEGLYMSTNDIGSLFFTVALFEGETEAVVIYDGIIKPIVNYPITIFGRIQIRYSTIGLAVLVLLCIICVPLLVTSSKKKTKVAAVAGIATTAVAATTIIKSNSDKSSKSVTQNAKTAIDTVNTLSKTKKTTSKKSTSKKSTSKKTTSAINSATSIIKGLSDKKKK